MRLRSRQSRRDADRLPEQLVQDGRPDPVVTTADGTEVGTITAPADDGAHAGIGTFTIPKDGAYLLFSKGSGINLYAVVVE